jgi:fatty acid desaturase
MVETPPVSAERSSPLSKQTKSQILARMPEFTELKPWRGVLAICTDWLIIFAAIFVSTTWPSLPVYLAAIVVVACRQHALLVIMHEATHLRLSPNRWWNDFLGESTCVPHFIALTPFRTNHMSHHRYNSTDKDPDWARLLPLQEWHFPKSDGEIFKIFAQYFYGYGLYEVVMLLIDLGKRGSQTPSKTPARRMPIVIRMSFYAVLLAVLIYFHQMTNLVLYWLIPFFFVLPLIMRVRGIAEHYGLPMEHDLNDTRNVCCGWLEQFILSPHSVNMHLDHHLYPGVPFYNLPKLHRFLRQFKEYRDHAHNNTSYVLPSRHSMLSDLRFHHVPEPIRGLRLLQEIP